MDTLSGNRESCRYTFGCITFSALLEDTRWISGPVWLSEKEEPSSESLADTPVSSECLQKTSKVLTLLVEDTVN